MWRMKVIREESQEQKDPRSRPNEFRIIAKNVAIPFKMKQEFDLLKTQDQIKMKRWNLKIKERSSRRFNEVKRQIKEWKFWKIEEERKKFKERQMSSLAWESSEKWKNKKLAKTDDKEAIKNDWREGRAERKRMKGTN